jgi:hypothetical protein
MAWNTNLINVEPETPSVIAPCNHNLKQKIFIVQTHEKSHQIEEDTAAHWLRYHSHLMLAAFSCTIFEFDRTVSLS